MSNGGTPGCAASACGHFAKRRPVQATGMVASLYNSMDAANLAEGWGERKFNINSEFGAQVLQLPVPAFDKVDSQSAKSADSAASSRLAQQQPSQSLLHSTTSKTIRIILIGKTGSGKSSLGNSLLNQNTFKVGRGMRSETAKCEWHTGKRSGTLIELVDTPGLCDTDKDDDVIFREVGKSVAVACPGPHLLVLALRTDRRFTKEEYQAYVKLKELFSEEMSKYLIIVFNGMDVLADTIAEQKKALDEEVKKMPGELKQVLQDANSRYVVMNNKATPADKETLLQEVMIKFLEQMKGAIFHTTTFFEKLLLRELRASHRKMCNSRLAMIYPRTAEFTRVAEFVDYFEQKISEGRKTTASAMKDAVSRIFAELSINMSCALARPLLSVILFIMILMIRGCSTNPLPQASCTARHCVVGEPTAVTCLFGKNISASKLGVNVQMFPFNAPSNITGKDVLMCSRKKNTTTCFVAEGYSFNYNISDRLTLEIPVATPEIAGVYKCHVASEDSPPRACNLTVTEGSESTPTPTTTHATTGKETSNTTEPRRTLGLGTDMIVVLIFLVTLTGLVCLLIVTVLKLYKRIKPITQNREAEDKETLLATKRNASANDKKYTKTDL